MFTPSPPKRDLPPPDRPLNDERSESVSYSSLPDSSCLVSGGSFHLTFVLQPIVSPTQSPFRARQLPSRRASRILSTGLPYPNPRKQSLVHGESSSDPFFGTDKSAHSSRTTLKRRSSTSLIVDGLPGGKILSSFPSPPPPQISWNPNMSPYPRTPQSPISSPRLPLFPPPTPSQAPSPSSQIEPDDDLYALGPSSDHAFAEPEGFASTQLSYNPNAHVQSPPSQPLKEYERALRKLYASPNAEFRSVEQFQAAWVLTQPEPSFNVYVEKTGAGKTTALQLAASMIPSDRTIVYISPYNVLSQTIPGHMQRIGLSCLKFSPDMVEFPQILILPLEMVPRPSVAKVLKMLCKTNKLCAIVMDEIRTHTLPFFFSFSFPICAQDLNRYYIFYFRWNRD